jgi:hypothetical protein
MHYKFREQVLKPMLNLIADRKYCQEIFGGCQTAQQNSVVKKQCRWMDIGKKSVVLELKTRVSYI